MYFQNLIQNPISYMLKTLNMIEGLPIQNDDGCDYYEYLSPDREQTIHQNFRKSLTYHFSKYEYGYE